MSVKNFFKVLFHQGVNHPRHKSREKSVVLLNQLAILSGLFMLLLFVVLLKYDNLKLNYAILFSVIVCLTVPVFGRFGWSFIIRYVALGALCSSDFMATSIFGFESGSMLFIIPIIIGVFIIWQNDPLPHLLLAISIPIIQLFALHFTDYSIFLDAQISHLEIKQVSKEIFLMVIIALGIVLFFYFYLLNKNEQRIKIAQDELKAIFDNSIDAFFLVDLTTHIIVRCNSSALRLFEADSEKEIVGKKGRYFSKVIPTEEMVEELIAILHNNGIYKTQMEYISFKGSHFWGDVVITKITQNTNGGTYLVRISDITESKNRQLKEAELTKELVRHNQNLEQFSFITSHNLRAPVSGMAGVLEVFNRTNYADPQNKAVIEMMEKLVKNLDTVINDLNQLLTIKQLTDDKKEELHFQGLLDEIKIGLSRSIESNDVSLNSDFKEAATVFSIKSYVYSIFNNLISNSIKYRSLERPCVIKVHSRKIENWVELTIIDNGIGIDLDKYGNELFGLYKRFHEGVEGKGLGLHMVKLQAEAIGAEIKVESTVNHGTKFTVLFKSKV